MPRGPKKPPRALKAKDAPAGDDDAGDWFTSRTGRIYVLPKMPSDADIDAALAKIRRKE